MRLETSWIYFMSSPFRLSFYFWFTFHLAVGAPFTFAKNGADRSISFTLQGKKTRGGNIRCLTSQICTLGPQEWIAWCLFDDVSVSSPGLFFYCNDDNCFILFRESQYEAVLSSIGLCRKEDYGVKMAAVMRQFDLWYIVVKL